MGKMQTITKSLKEKWCIRLKIKNDVVEDYDGVVVHVGRSVVVLQQEKDFEFDGYQCFSKKNIVGYRDGKFEVCTNAVLKYSKTISQVEKLKWFAKVNTISEFLSEVQKRDIWPAVELICNSESAFYIGPVGDVGPKEFYLHCYDAEGVWEKEYELSCTEVVRVEIFSKYCEYFNNYMNGNKIPRY